ncbi:unnamed protein product [Rangifer tarandus platyrhynchus]|uniref:Uncharacterized protein n=2 Tax=Rangifer tarandus platyrhynchus TaxID=3082113 RepID=A0ACB0DRZ6_RANTA|nr:unnamed protein product [Rangifer tarandus platyrhynchus]
MKGCQDGWMEGGREGTEGGSKTGWDSRPPSLRARQQEKQGPRRDTTIYTLLYILFLLYIQSVHVGVNAVK